MGVQYFVGNTLYDKLNIFPGIFSHSTCCIKVRLGTWFYKCLVFYLVLLFYRPPGSDNPDYLAQLDTCLSRIPENARIWLSGDFNLADINWTDSSVKGSASKPGLCNQLINITADRFLQQLVSQPTRITETTENTLNLFFCNNTVEVISSISDHEAVYIEASLRPHKTPQPPRTVFCYN